jgi:type II secretory pathway component GspD/PulD (secretin)
MNNKKFFKIFMGVVLIALFATAPSFADSDVAKVKVFKVIAHSRSVKVFVKADKPFQYHAIRVTDPEQALVFDVSPAVLWGKKETITVNQGAVQSAEIAQFSTNPDVVRIVLRLSSQLDYKAELSSLKNTLFISLNPYSKVAVDDKRQLTVEKTPPQGAPVWENVKIEKKVVAGPPGYQFVPGLTSMPKANPIPSADLSLRFHKFLAKASLRKKVVRKKVFHKVVASQEQYITAHWRNADLTDVVRQLADRLHMNVLVDSSVKGSVTMDLNHVPASQALGMILAINGYSYRQFGTLLVVAPPDKLSTLPAITAAMGPQAVQVIPLEYAKASDMAKTIQEEFPGVVVNIGPNNELIVRATVSTIKQVRQMVSELDKASPPPVPPQKAVIQLNYAKVSDVLSQIKPLLPPDAILIADSRLNSIIVVGTPYDIDTVRSFVSAVDVADPQVMLSMQVISVDMNKSSAVGIEWPGAATTAFTEVPSGPLPTEGGTLPQADTGNGGGLVLNNLGFHTFVRDNIQLISRLHFLVTHNYAKVLGAPRVATVNDKTATIQLGQRLPIVYFDPRAGMYQVQYIDVGVILNVTPHISPDGYITVHVNPVVSQVTGFIQNFPQLETRQADTTVRVKNGQTIVIGGLLNDTVTNAVTKIPLLGDIPIIGELFKYTQKNHDRTDLVISITPTILSDKD